MNEYSSLISLLPLVVSSAGLIISILSAMIAWLMRQHTKKIQLIEYKRSIRITAAQINSLWNDFKQEVSFAKVKSSTLAVDDKYMKRIKLADDIAKKGQANLAKVTAEYKKKEKDLTIKDAVEEILTLEEMKISVQGDVQRIRNEFRFCLD